MPLLEKMLKLQRSTRRDARRPRQTSALLIDLVKDPKERGERRREAALLMAERGDVRDAAELLEQALVEDPQDEEALVALCGLADRLPKGFGAGGQAGPRARRAAARGEPTRRPARRRARAVAASRRAGRARRRPSPPSRRSSRSSRSIPTQLAGARSAGRAVQGSPRLRGRRDRESPPAARARHHPRRLAARAGRRLRRPRPDRSRALLPRGAGAARAGDQGRGGVPRRRTRRTDLKPDDPYATSSRIRIAAITSPSPRRR